MRIGLSWHKNSCRRRGRNEMRRRKNARKWRKVRDTIVYRDACWKSESCTTGEKINQSSVVWDVEGSAGDKGLYEPLGTLTPLTDLLYTALVPSSMSLSPSTHRSRTFAPSTDISTSLFAATLTMSAATFHHGDTDKKGLWMTEDKAFGPCIW